MFLALDENKQPVSIDEAKRGGSYFCPVCDSKVTFKAGTVRIPHFSHYRIEQCIRYLYKSESIQHLQTKHDLYLHIKTSRDVDMEIYLSEIEQIPDLLMDKTAIEIQLSTISIELLLTRTEGYKTLGMNVVWLLDEHALNPEQPTQFQLSTMKSHHLFTYDIDAKSVYRYRMIYFDGFRWYYTREMVDATALDQPPTQQYYKFYKISETTTKKLVQKARKKGSVRDVTLGSLYQLEWQLEDIPEWMMTITPSERWILNSPLEWKLFVYYAIKNQSFDLVDFMDFISLRSLYDVPSKQEIARALMQEYYMLNTSQNVTELEISS